MVFSSDTDKKWNDDHTSKEGIGDKLRDAAQSQIPLKLRIGEAQRKLQILVAKLDGISFRMQEKDRVIFGRIVRAMQNHDSNYGKLLSGELSQIRKIIKMLDSAKVAFEQLQLRFNTMAELGDVVVTLNPAMNAIKGIQGGLSSMIPQADQSFGQISNLLGNTMTDSSHTSNMTAQIDSSSIKLDEQAIDILQEATFLVEENTRDKFPDLQFSKDKIISSNRTASFLDLEG